MGETNTAVEENKRELEVESIDINNKNESNDEPSSGSINQGTSIRTNLLTESQKESRNENNELADSEHEHIAKNKEESNSNETCPQKSEIIKEKEISEESNDQHEQEEINEKIMGKEGHEDVEDEFKEQANNTEEEKGNNHLDMDEVNMDNKENEL